MPVRMRLHTKLESLVTAGLVTRRASKELQAHRHLNRIANPQLEFIIDNIPPERLQTLLNQLKKKQTTIPKITEEAKRIARAREKRK